MALRSLVLLGLLGLTSGAEASETTVPGPDGAPLAATTWGEGGKGVLLVHDVGRSARDWAGLGPELAAAGLHVLAVTAASPSPDVVEAGIEWLQNAGADEVQIVAAGAGSLAALSVPEPRVTSLVVLSPPLRGAGTTLSSVAASVGTRALLVVATRANGAGPRAAEHLAGKAQGAHVVTLYDGPASGARLLSAEPTLEPLIVSWLTGTHSALADWTTDSSPAVQSRGLTDIEAQGRRFEDR